MSQQFHQQNPSSSGQNDGRQNNFMQNQFHPEMVNMTLRAGNSLMVEQRAKWMPGLSDFWNSLKMYFAVSNNYVLKKIFIVLYPIKNQAWGRVKGEETDAEVLQANHPVI